LYTIKTITSTESHHKDSKPDMFVCAWIYAAAFVGMFCFLVVELADIYYRAVNTMQMLNKCIYLEVNKLTNQFVGLRLCNSCRL